MSAANIRRKFSPAPPSLRAEEHYKRLTLPSNS